MYIAFQSHETNGSYKKMTVKTQLKNDTRTLCLRLNVKSEIDLMDINGQ